MTLLDYLPVARRTRSPIAGHLCSRILAAGVVVVVAAADDDFNSVTIPLPVLVLVGTDVVVVVVVVVDVAATELPVDTFSRFIQNIL